MFRSILKAISDPNWGRVQVGTAKQEPEITVIAQPKT